MEDTLSERSSSPVVVAIGASAGGLAAIFEFFEAMDADLPVAFVVIQHLSPDHPSMMPELLGRHTRLDVEAVVDGSAPRPGAIHLIPPNTHLVLVDGRFQLRPRARDAMGRSLPVDVFFSSVAAAVGERAVAVVLSGSGSDGSLGLLDVVRAGGHALVQEPSTAGFDGMPMAAIRTGLVDQVGSPSELAAAVATIVRLDNRVSTGELPLGDLTPLLAALHEQQDIDLSLYKETTLRRRAGRRMVLVGLSDLDAYVERVRHNPVEAAALLRDVLIGVTAFFRDPDAWEVLRAQALEPLARDRGRTTPLRVWVCGCSTGEEVYTLAMLLAEVFEAEGREVDARIFATDLSEDAVNTAAAGIYTAEQLEPIGADRIARFFLPVGPGRYRVTAEIRRLIVFARHDVTRETPFSRVDLVLCRNLLIYMKPPLQRRVLHLLRFALVGGGVMLLGQAETLLDLRDRFEVIDASHRIFRARGDARVPLRDLMGDQPLRPSRVALPAPRATLAPGDTSVALLRDVVDALLGARYGTALVVKGSGLVYLMGRTPPYLRFMAGRPSADLSGLLPEALWTRVHSALLTARGAPRASRPSPFKVVFPFEGEDLVVEGAVHALPVAHGEGSRELVLFAPQREAEPEEEVAVGAGADPQQVLQLSREVQQVRESLQTTIEELETTNEEHQSTNEELLASNEELQSTNEELHSVNQELKTLNTEYQEKILQLLELQADVDGLLEALTVGILFLDGGGRLLRFNRAAAAVFHVASIDVGRPLWHLADEFVDPHVRQALRAALDEGEEVTAEGDTTGGDRIRAELSRISGPSAERFVVTLVDLTDAHRARQELQRAHGLLAGLAKHLPDVLWVLEPDGTYRFVSEAFERLWGVPVEDVMRDPGRLAERIDPEDRERVVDAFARGLDGKGFDETYRVLRPDGSLAWVRARGVPVRDPRGHLLHSIGSFADVTAQVSTQAERDEGIERLQLTVQALGEVVYDHQVARGLFHWDGAYEEALGYRADTIGRDASSWIDRVHPVDLPLVEAAFARALAGDRVFEHRYRFRKADGNYVWVVDRGSMQVDGNGTLRRVVGAIRPLGPARTMARPALSLLQERLGLQGGGRWSWVVGSDRLHMAEGLAPWMPPRVVEGLRRASHRALDLGDPVFETLTGDDEHGDLLLLGTVGIDADDHVVVAGRVVDLQALQDSADDEHRRMVAGRHLLDQLPLAAWVQDVDGNVVVGNQRRTTWRLDPAEERRMVAHLTPGATVREQRVLEHDTLGTRMVRSTRRWLVDGLLLCTEEDITDQRRSEDDLRQRASRDALTGLVMREVFVEQLSVLCTRSLRAGARTFAVLFMDLDGFKEVNDSYDHFVGDALLVGFAQRLQALARPGDTVARFGGDEFAILVEQVSDYRDVLAVARRIHEADLEPIIVGERSFTVRASIGIAVFDPDRHTPESLLRDADVAMYEAKRSPDESTVVFDAQMHAQVLQRHETKRDLDVALEREEFRLHLQPIHTPHGRRVGFETLLRWEHPRRGLLPPAEFLGLATESGLMSALEGWVLERALAVVAAHPEVFDASDPPLLAVNVTPQLLRSTTFRDWVARAKASKACERACFLIEIVEETLLSTDPAVRRSLQAARSAGMKVAIDDFGTGYSSLSYLMNWPIDLLKLDGSFAAQVDNERAVKVVRALVDLAESLDLETLLECVEDDAQLAFSEAVGVDYVQGHRFGEAMAPDDLFGTPERAAIPVD